MRAASSDAMANMSRIQGLLAWALLCALALPAPLRADGHGPLYGKFRPLRSPGDGTAMAKSGRYNGEAGYLPQRVMPDSPGHSRSSAYVYPERPAVPSARPAAPPVYLAAPPGYQVMPGSRGHVPTPRFRPDPRAAQAPGAGYPGPALSLPQAGYRFRPPGLYR